MNLWEKTKNIFKKSITTAETLPLHRTAAPVRAEWDYNNAVKHGYKRSATVYSCINLIAKSAAQVEWKTYRRNRSGTWEEAKDHPLTMLIENPNPFMSQKDFIERMTHALYLGGNALFSKVRGTNNAVVELWYLPQDHTKPVPDQRDFISHYKFEGNGIKRNIETKDIIHNQFLNPNNLFWGIAPIKAAAEIIDTDNEAIEWNRYSMQQRAVSDGAFVLDQPLTKEQWKEAREQITEQHTGASNGRNFWVLGAGAQWQPLSLSPVEMDFIESRKMNREEICSIFGVPPVMIGLYENATLANIETGRKIFWLDTILPYLADIRNCLNSTLAAEYGSDIKVDFDASTIDAIQENIGEKINNARTLFAMGVPFNQINQRLDLGFDEVEGGDTGFLPSNLVPADLFTEAQRQPEAQTQSETNREPQTNESSNSNSNTAEEGKSLNRGENNAILKKREFYWKAIERKRTPYDLAMTRKAARIFKDMAKSVADGWKNGKKTDRLIDAHEKEWRDLYELTYRQIFDDLGNAEYRDIVKQVQGKSYDPVSEQKDEQLDTIINSEIRKWITLTAATKVTNVLEFTKSEIAALILKIEEQYQEEGYSAHVDRIHKAISEKFTDFSRYRAYRIARTEVAGASNAAAHTAQKAAQQTIDPSGQNFVLKREWITARDDRVRESHELLDGKVADLDGGFKVFKRDESGQLVETDQEIDYPADYIADQPDNTINCRCTTRTIIENV